MSNRDLVVEELKNYDDDNDIKPILDIVKGCAGYSNKELEEVLYIIKHPEEYNTFEFWKKDYINGLIAQNDNEKLEKMSEKEYKEVEKKVFELCENDDTLWNDIDFHVQENINNVVGEE